MADLGKYKVPDEWLIPWKSYGGTNIGKLFRSEDVKSNIETERLHDFVSEESEEAEKKNEIMSYVTTAIAFIPFGGITTTILSGLLPTAGAAIGFLSSAIGKTLEQYATTHFANEMFGFKPDRYTKEVKHQNQLKNQINTQVQEMGFKVPKLGEMFATQFVKELNTQVIQQGIVDATENATKWEIIDAQKQRFKDIFGFGEGSWKFNKEAADIIAGSANGIRAAGNIMMNDITHKGLSDKIGHLSPTTKMGQEYGLGGIDIPNTQYTGFFNPNSISSGLSSSLSEEYTMSKNYLTSYGATPQLLDLED